DRSSTARQHTSTNIGNYTACDGCVAAELDEIIVIVERDIRKCRVGVGIVRPLSDRRRNHQCLREIAGQSKARRRKRHALKKPAAIEWDVEWLRFVFHKGQKGEVECYRLPRTKQPIKTAFTAQSC